MISLNARLLTSYQGSGLHLVQRVSLGTDIAPRARRMPWDRGCTSYQRYALDTLCTSYRLHPLEDRLHRVPVLSLDAAVALRVSIQLRDRLWIRSGDCLSWISIYRESPDLWAALLYRVGILPLATVVISSCPEQDVKSSSV